MPLLLTPGELDLLRFMRRDWRTMGLAQIAQFLEVGIGEAVHVVQHLSDGAKLIAPTDAARSEFQVTMLGAEACGLPVPR